MKKEWSGRKLVIAFILELILILFALYAGLSWLGYRQLKQKDDTIFYDRFSKQYVSLPGFWDLMTDNVINRKYIGIHKELEFTGLNADKSFAYRAKLSILNRETVRQFLANDPKNLKKVLQKKVIECVDVLVKQKYQEIGNPYRMIRTFSITSATMDEFCPVHLSTGYEWTNNLEIAQCDAFPKDGYQEMNCLDRVRYFHY